MIVKTLFSVDGRFQPGEVEVRLLAGVPQLHVVGQPDSHIREVGIKLKSSLKALGLKWPRGHQIVVNLRPSNIRKHSSGAELAIALGFLGESGQLSEQLSSRLKDCVVYGELALDGRVLAPADLAVAAASCGKGWILTGAVGPEIREGRWLSMSSLGDSGFSSEERSFDWDAFWKKPDLPSYRLHEAAARALWVTLHSRLSVLVAGPQGTGKTTWAEAMYALTSKPELQKVREGIALFGESALESRWRPFERPHHSITPLAMIGGGVPLQAGVISRAHGGVLVMDEFLEFEGRVLEGLREPLETGYVEHARCGDRAKFPADFQLVGTTNLCPCGKLNPNPEKKIACSHSLGRCRSVCYRLSGPIMDRFDWMLMSHEWLGNGRRVGIEEVAENLERVRAFAKTRGPVATDLPEWIASMALSHRRRRAVLRVARALADGEESREIQYPHFAEAYDLVVQPMEAVKQIFA